MTFKIEIFGKCEILYRNRKLKYKIADFDLKCLVRKLEDCLCMLIIICTFQNWIIIWTKSTPVGNKET